MPQQPPLTVPTRPAIGFRWGCPGVWLWLSLFLPMASLYHPEAGWNANTRLDLVFALVDGGTVRIDDYHDLGPYSTGDKAHYGGHFYSDKVFGLSIIGVVPYAVLSRALNIIGLHPEYPVAHWWIRIWAVSTVAAGVGLFLWRFLQRMGISERQAFLLVCFLFFGSLLFPYATVFFPYLPGIFLGLLAWDRMETWALNPNSQPRPHIQGFVIGLLLGSAILMDFIFGLMVVGLAARAFWLWRNSRLVGRALAATLGGAIPLIGFAVYTVSIFGTLSIPYQFEADPLFRAGMSHGFMGVTGFQPAVLYYLTVHPYRGLFFYSPILAVGVVGAARLLLGGIGKPGASRQRWVGGLALAMGAAYILFNASYYMWWGGWTMGPRLLIPAVPFLGLGVAGVWKWGRGGRAAVIAAGVCSLALTLPPALVDPQTPMWLHKWPSLLHPTLGQNLAAEQFLQMILFERGQICPTLGTFLGLPGLWALVPTLALGVLPAVLFLRTTRES